MIRLEIVPDEAAAITAQVAAAGVDVLDLSLAAQGGGKLPMTTSACAKDETPGGAVDLAAKLRRASGLPVIAVGRLGPGPARPVLPALERESRYGAS